MFRLKVRLTPRGSRDEVIGWRGDALAIKLAAPPVEGAANRAAVEFIAGLLGVKKSQVRLISGEKSRDKTFEVEGLDESEIARRIESL